VTAEGKAQDAAPEAPGTSDLAAASQRPQSLWSRRRVIGAVTAVSAAVIGLSQFTSSVEHLAGILPGVDDQPPTALKAEIADLTVVAHDVPLAAVYRDLSLSSDGVSAADLATEGELLAYRVEFSGFAGKTCVLTWTLYDAETLTPVPDGYWRTIHAPAFPQGALIVEADDDAVNGEVWIPHVAPGRYYVDLEVNPPDPNRKDFLAWARLAEPFVVAA
jgi:hypothetical protein